MEYETSTENKLIEYGNTVKSKVRLAEGAKAWYLSTHGEKMPHALQMIVDSSWGTSGEILDTAIELQDEVKKLKHYISCIESLIMNGPESMEEPESTNVPQGEKSDWVPTEQDLKGLSTDGRVS